MTERGRFISLEGLEGVGKTTNRGVIESLLKHANIDYIATREPGGTTLGESLRNLVLHAKGSMQDQTELLLMVASRIEHVSQVIEPALASGQWVLCDRFMDASVAYQGAGRRLGVQLVNDLHIQMGMQLRPDLTLLLDMPVEEGLARMSARGKPDRIESEKTAFFNRARAAYLEIAKNEPERVVIINAREPITAVKRSVEAAIRPLISCELST